MIIFHLFLFFLNIYIYKRIENKKNKKKLCLNCVYIKLYIYEIVFNLTLSKLGSQGERRVFIGDISGVA